MNNIINLVRASMQEAYNISAVLEHVAKLGDNCSGEDRQLYWSILYDCAKNIRLNLADYSCSYTPVKPFAEGADLPQIIRGINETRA